MLQPIFDEHPMIGLDGVWIKRGERQDAKPIAGTLIHDSESLPPRHRSSEYVGGFARQTPRRHNR
jgi:hypothetical protein